jgi:hypothetical protein
VWTLQRADAVYDRGADQDYGRPPGSMMSNERDSPISYIVLSVCHQRSTPLGALKFVDAAIAR